MAERNPNSNKAEREADYSTYSGIAADFFDRYVGDATPSNVEDVDAWRQQTRDEVADHMANIARDMPQEERVKAYADIIDGLKELRSYTGAAPMEVNTEAAESKADEAPEDLPDDDAKSTLAEKARLAKANAEIAIRSNPQYLSLPGIFAAAKHKLDRFAEKATPRKEGESDEAYERRVRRRKVGAGIAAIALAAGGAWMLKETVGSAPGENNEFVSAGPESESEAGFGESDYQREDRAIDFENIPQTYEQSVQTELDFLAENGRINNDFNHIDQFADKESIMGELQEQYAKSPTELSGQLYQIQGIEGTVDVLPDHLRVLDGETYEQYTARLSEALHHDPELHDILTEYTTGYVSDKFNIQDMPGHYQAAYIDAEGNSYWDSSVSSSDPNDKIIMLADGKGIRLPCGQPVELIYIKEGATHGIGGAPIPVQDFSYVPQSTPDTPGVGGPPPATETIPPMPATEPPVPETAPPVPETEPPVPETLAPKEGDFHADKGAPKAEAGPPAPPAQTETNPVFIDQQPGQSIPTEQLGGQIPDATQGTGGSRAEQGVGNTGAEAGAADLNQSSESAVESAAPIPNQQAPTNPGTNISNPFGG